MENDKIIINQLISQWDFTIGKVTQQLSALGEWATDKEVAPGRNTVTFILGHLVTYHDRIIEALEFGERFFPELDELFAKSQDKNDVYPAFDDLLDRWIKVNRFLSENFKNLSVEDWLSKHHYVSSSEFVLEPHRNKLAIFTTRYTHLYSHVGQLRLIKPY